jgi:Protein tyrosine and serine/threonine kinase/EF-hand domain pair
MAPEMATRLEYSEKTDVFAFGIMLWEMFAAEVPYSDCTDVTSGVDLLFKICQGVRPDMARVTHVGSTMKRLMQQCWEADPQRRPTMQSVLDLLRGNDPAAIFRSIDKDNSGTLNFGELVQFLQRYAPQVKPSEMHSIFEAIDEDKSGDITFPEFKQFWDIVQRNGLSNALTLCQRARSRRTVASKDTPTYSKN